MVFGLKEEDDNLLQIDEDMITVIADKIITKRMGVLENKMTREFDAKLRIVMEEQYHNKKRINTLEETIVKQNNEIAKLQNMEETLNLQRQEITALNEIVLSIICVPFI
jgi:TolA-binding protein